VNTRGPSIVWGILAFVIGALPAFMLAGPVFFTVGSMSRGLLALAMYAAALFVLALGGGALAASKRLAMDVGLSLPVLLVLLLAVWGSAGTYLLAVVFVVAAGVCAWAGTWAGARLTSAVVARRRR
jgi:hypothetical protein